jgi:superfamily II DNA or RNA helicase|tara:strand:- start:2674 stop:3945 length:1272 start_codon:yes stop_codon:yes gene_type:complete
MDKDFGIKIENHIDPLPQFVIDQNTAFAELYDWQKRAIDYFFDNKCNAVYEVTTGVGKTLFSVELIKILREKNPDLQVLVVVPKNVIMETGWYKELYDAGISIKDIGIYYGNVKEYAPITITNMQNMDNIAVNLFDMVIWDEVHNYGTERLLEHLNHPYKYRVGLSATLERIDEKHYDIMKVFDYNVFKYTPSEALEDGILNPFNFVNIGVVMDEKTTEEYTDLTKNINSIMQAGGGYKNIMRTMSTYRNVMLAKMNKRKELVNNYYEKGDVVKQLCEKHKNDKVLIFNQYNKQTSALYWTLLDLGLQARIFHSGIPKEKRDEVLIDFKNDKFNILLTTKVLDEGYNLPKLDVGIIMAGDSTAKQTVQRLGRVLRKKDKKSHLYQLYCMNTIEDVYSNQRAKTFKQLSSDFKDLTYTGEKLKI